MYQKIEEEFKKKSIKNKHALAFLAFVLVCVVILTAVLYKLGYNDYRFILVAIAGVIIMYLIAYLYI